ncbi:G-type lectin S-receptor serine/threonine-protein kinase [Spatholobus suberectus]|nr:G-type lectin S-receptor serine/threonine-protein kinase [Spatholobus suberectus]
MSIFHSMSLLPSNTLFNHPSLHIQNEKHMPSTKITMLRRIKALLLSLTLFMISVVAISPSSTLYASDTSQAWSSPNNTFSLHFLQVQPPTSPPSYMVGIVHSGGVPIIWTVGGGSGNFVDSRGSFQLLSNGSLQLVDGSGAIVWDSGTSHLGVSSAFLDEQGNLVLSNGTSTVWSSFDHPTDTIVPSQNFTPNMILKSGLYSFRLHPLGNLLLSWNGSDVYWNHTLSDSINWALTWPILVLEPEGKVSVHDPNLTSTVVVAYSSDYAEGSDVLRVLKLDGDGNLRIYSSSKGNETAIIRWAAVKDQCDVHGYCGTYGICRYKDSGPVCGCPSQDFEMVDPNNSRNGCRRKVQLEDCPKRVGMLQLDHSRLLTYPSIAQYKINPEVLYIPMSACRGNCLSADSCFASTSLSDGSGFCYVKTKDIFGGYQSPALTSTTYIKVCLPLAPNSSPIPWKEKDWSMHAWIIVVLVFGTLLGLTAFQGGLWLWCCRNIQRFGGLYGQYDLVEYASGALVQFSYKELKGLTNGFKEKLGAGRFGSVYRGMLGNGTVVAVKQLQGIELEEKQFKLEIATVCSTHHMNLVRMIGFCSERKHKLLVYEYMKNGSLDKFLFGQSGTLLDWECRFNIALGCARGIMYIHEECHNCIVHCNIKPENILLDENFKAKLSDFNLVKFIIPEDCRYQTMVNMRETKGYVAPEWLSNLSVTSKSDVYSYGMVLLEIVSGRRNFEISEETNNKEFSVWAYEEFEKGNMMGIVDKRLPEVNLDQLKRLIQASFWCLQEQPSQRPAISKVLHMLEGVTKIKKPPAPK